MSVFCPFRKHDHSGGFVGTSSVKSFSYVKITFFTLAKCQYRASLLVLRLCLALAFTADVRIPLNA